MKLAFIENQAKYLMTQGFDSVQIFTTMIEDKGMVDEKTRSFTFGCGNYHARYGLVRSWVDREEGEAREDGAIAMRMRRKE